MIDYENLGLLNSSFFDEYKDNFANFLDSGWYILGQQVKVFEEQFANYNNSKCCIGVASGLDALILALDSFGFESNSEVIVPSNTYIATILAILRCGLKPVLVEPDISTYNINPNLIEEKITSKTKAIMPVHLYGKCCQMDKIINTAQKHDLRIIEDAAQAHGASYKGQKAGTFGEIGAFSFYPTKNLGALGDGGAIITNNIENAQKVSKLRNYGSNQKYYNDHIGYNSRLDELQAGFLSIKLNSLDRINTHKRKLAKLYLDNLSNNFIKPVVEPEYYDVYHIFNIRHSARDQLREYLLKNSIKTEIHYPVPPHKQKALDNVWKDEYPISEEIHKTTLSLPISYCHTKDDILQVIEVLNKF